jgi:DNA repair exonuclease SbcCD ATPase subunit
MEAKNTIQSKTRKEIESISERIRASRFGLKDAVVPLSVAIILIILGVFVFVPMVRTAISFRGEHKKLKERETELQELEEKLKSIDEDVLQIDLLNSKEIIPQSLRVSAFMFYIDTLANEKSLYAKSLTAGDTQISVVKKDQENDERTVYYGVSSPLLYEGSLENILSFLDDLYEASPYVISAQRVSLKRTGQVWRVTLSVTGYYVPEATLEVDPFVSFESYTEYEDTIDVFTQKAEQLKN